MKNTLEYKILKYLYDNDNGKYISVDHIENNGDLLESKINNLLKSKYIDRQLTPSFKKSYIEYINPKYKIEFIGIEYFKSFNEKPLTKYQKIYLTLFVLSVILTVIFGYLSYSLNKDNNSLESDLNSLKIQSDFYKDSIIELRKQIKLNKIKSINDTLQTKSLNNLKVN